MKVGVLTFHAGPNYGGYYQALCLCEAIASLGHDACIINYKNAHHFQKEKLRPSAYRRPLKLWHDFQKHRAFKQAIDLMPLSAPEVVTSTSGIRWNDYDAIVIGSDIVWNRSLATLGRDEVYFGRLGSEFSGRKIAYAPSIGPMPIDYDVPEWMSEALRDFHAIGVRDPNTAAFAARHLDDQPRLVADPTWLADPVAPVPSQAKRHEDRLLVYSFPLVRECSHWADKVKEFARSKNLKIDVAGYYQSFSDRNLGSISPDEWQRLFGRYKYVVSGTFHGGLFSIREQAQFCIIPHKSINSKLKEALKATSLESRLLTDPSQLLEQLEIPIDYSQVDKGRESYRQSSLAFLRDALS